jgi:hypothetical protein
MSFPNIDTTSATELLNSAIEKAKTVSGGKLTDFSSASPVTAILEASAIAGTAVIQEVNSLANTLETNRIAYFGVERRLGTSALGQIRVTLDAIYADSFRLPAGFRFSQGQTPWETTQDLTIPPYTTSGTTFAIALINGKAQPPDTITYPATSRVATIDWEENPSGGQDAESDSDWRGRILGTLRRRETLLSEDDFEQAIRDYLGDGAIALAVGRLKPDKATYDNGYVGCFGLNADGSVLSQSQKSFIEGELNKRAAMALVTLWDLESFTVNVKVYTAIQSSSSPELIAADVRQKVTDFFSLSNQSLDSPVLNKALERRIQDVPGCVEGIVAVYLNDLPQPVVLPNRWTVPKLGAIAITLTSQGQEFQF